MLVWATIEGLNLVAANLGQKPDQSKSTTEAARQQFVAARRWSHTIASIVTIAHSKAANALRMQNDK